MPDILADFSQASMAHAVEANLFAFFHHLRVWPRVELHDDARYLWTLSDLPFPLFNSVVRARLSDAEADAGIDARIRDCGDRRVPMLWWTGPASTPADLVGRLERRGFVTEPAFGMAAALESMPTLPRDRDITVEAVDDARTLAVWRRVLCGAFGAPHSFGDAFADLVTVMGLDAASPFKHFLGRVLRRRRCRYLRRRDAPGAPPPRTRRRGHACRRRRSGRPRLSHGHPALEHERRRDVSRARFR
jgi:hypothetical protein